MWFRAIEDTCIDGTCCKAESSGTERRVLGVDKVEAWLLASGFDVHFPILLKY